MELEDKEKGDVIEGEDHVEMHGLFWGVKLVYVICYKQVLIELV